RLQSLQKHGEEGWKNRVQKDDDALLSPQPSRSKARPASLMERVSLLETSSEQWRDRVTQSDATKFTVAHKMASASSVPSLTPSGERKTTSSSVSISSSTSVAISETMLSSPASERKKRSPQPKVFKSKTGSCLPELLSKGIAQSSPIFEAKKGSKDFSRSISIPSEVSNEPDADENSSTVVSIPRPDDEHFESFFASTSVKGVNNSDDAQFDTADFDVISSSSSKLTVQRREVRLTRKNQGKRNPLRALAQRTDIKDEYTEFSLGVGERELRRMKVEELSKSSSLAMEALAGLASKENFSSVALKKVEDTPVQRELAPYSELMLIHIKGRRHPQVRLVAPFCSSVNQGDDFLLVTPFELFHYKGRYSNVIERAVASEMALYILQTKDLGVTSALKVTDVEEGSAAGKRERFWKKLGGTVNSEGLPPGLPDADDHIEAALIASNKIFEVKDQALVPLEEAWGQSPKYELLSSDKVLVFDFGSELYLWSGKRAPLVEKKKGTALLKELWKEKYDYSDCDVNPIFPPVDLGHMTDVVGLRPSWCICAKITENVETILFKEKFLDWPDTAQQHRIKEVRVEEEQKPEPVCELKLCDVESMINTRPEEPDLVLEMSHLGRGVTYYDEEVR
ncbi:Supervillin, partial [Armadillidium vulgare]